MAFSESVRTLNGTNYDDWKESLDLYLILTKEDLALREPKPSDLTDNSSAEERSQHKEWQDSNRICLKVIKYTIDKSIRESIPEKEIALDYLKAIGENFRKSKDSEKAYYISLFNNTLYDGISGVRVHIMKLISYYNKLKSYGVDLEESFLVYQVLESLPTEYGVLWTIYNSQGAKWSIDQLIFIVTREEESIKKSRNGNGNGKNTENRGEEKKPLGPKKGGKINKGQKKFFKGECHYCKSSGHRISDCFKLKNKHEREGSQK